MGGHRRTILVVGGEDGLGLSRVATAVHRQTSRHHVLTSVSPRPSSVGVVLVVMTHHLGFVGVKKILG